MAPRHSLDVVLRVPIAVIQDTGISGLKVEADTARAGREKEDLCAETDLRPLT